MPDDLQLRRTLETLLSPLGAAGHLPDAWRDAVNRQLRLWTDADGGFFRISDGSPTRIDPLSTELLAARDAYRLDGIRALDPWAQQRVGPGEVLVAGFEKLLGEGWRERSPYWLEFLEPRGVRNYVGAQIGTELGEHVVLSYFDLWTEEDEAVIARRVRRLHSIVPALKAGLEVWLAVRKGPDELGGMVDEVPEALLLCDESGSPVHANSRLERLLAADPDGERLEELLEGLAEDFAAARDGDVHQLYPQAGERTVHTAGGAYTVRPVVADGRVRVNGDTPGILLMVRRKQRLAVPSPKGGRASTG